MLNHVIKIWHNNSLVTKAVYVFEHIFTRKHAQIENDAAVNAKYNNYALYKSNDHCITYSQPVHVYIMQKAIFENINLTEYYILKE